MCYAILKIKYRADDPRTVDVETRDELVERIEFLRGDTECVGYSVFMKVDSCERISLWESKMSHIPVEGKPYADALDDEVPF